MRGAGVGAVRRAVVGAVGRAVVGAERRAVVGAERRAVIGAGNCAGALAPPLSTTTLMKLDRTAPKSMLDVASRK